MSAQVASPWLTATEAARYLHVRREDFERAARAGKFRRYHDPAVYLGGSDRRTFFDARELDEFVRRGRYTA